MESVHFIHLLSVHDIIYKGECKHVSYSHTNESIFKYEYLLEFYYGSNLQRIRVHMKLEPSTFKIETMGAQISNLV